MLNTVENYHCLDCKRKQVKDHTPGWCPGVYIREGIESPYCKYKEEYERDNTRYSYVPKE